MPLDYAWEKIIDLLSDDFLDKKAHDQWAEMEWDQARVPLVINWPAILQREAAGTYRAFAQRRDGVLTGYIGFHFWRPDRHITTLYVQEDTIWVVPGPHRGLMWADLWRHALKAIPRPAKVQGQARSARAGRVLQRLGLPPLEMIHSAYIE